MILGVVHRSPGICLTAEENPRTPQLGDSLMKGMYNQSSRQMGSISSKLGRKDRTARQEGRRKEIRKGSEVLKKTCCCPWSHGRRGALIFPYGFGYVNLDRQNSNVVRLILRNRIRIFQRRTAARPRFITGF